MKALKLILVGISLGLTISAQAQQPANPTQFQVERSPDNPLYKGFDGCARNCTNGRKRPSDRSQALATRSLSTRGPSCVVQEWALWGQYVDTE
jgi:hypothetical protein